MINFLRSKHPVELSRFSDKELKLIYYFYYWKPEDLLGDCYLDEILSWVSYETYVDAVECLSDIEVPDSLYSDETARTPGKEQELAKQLLIDAGYDFYFIEETSSILVRRTLY